MSALDNLRPLDRECLSHIGQKFHQHRPVFQMPNPAAHAAIVFENHGRLREITPLCKYFRRDKRFQRSMVEWLRGQRFRETAHYVEYAGVPDGSGLGDLLDIGGT